MAQNKPAMSPCHWGWECGAKPQVRHMPDMLTQSQSYHDWQSNEHTRSRRYYIQQMAEMANSCYYRKMSEISDGQRWSRIDSACNVGSTWALRNKEGIVPNFVNKFIVCRGTCKISQFLSLLLFLCWKIAIYF